MKKIAVIVGSTRQGSWNRRVAQDLVSMLPEGFDAEFLSLQDLPFYDQEWDTPETIPAAVAELRSKADAADGFIILTPEYNRSMPAVLKNALDILSRPFGAKKMSGKPTLVASATPGAFGGFGASRDLRNVLAFLDAQVIGQPEVYLSFVHTLYADGELNEDTAKFLRSVVAKFVDAFPPQAK
ncbi:NAD(P)H-dependent oxidoreductase [Arcanobacterium pinnipediorum]|uniref:NAD(P)H-dependent oxidoreductase n=1 Tax=Arcanobacterium pinnipediorum TaxID=1503041 RepID=A0ABY5AGG9_9ACTO|nr:NAD(P)H-dependent oxidoreductase [Arcanobacterium pinnipediorum]USR79162.1 NAD(P)H-dependent oxidoreductase [Arcanobacterium pinnipediorum]